MCNHIFLLHHSVAGKDLSSNQKIKQIYGKAFLYFLALNNIKQVISGPPSATKVYFLAFTAKCVFLLTANVI